MPNLLNEIQADAAPSYSQRSLRVVVLSGYPETLMKFRGPMLAAMVAAGHEVIACAPVETGLFGVGMQDLHEQLRAIGVTFRPIVLERTGMNPAKDLRSLLSLTALLRELRPDAVLAYTPKLVIYGSLATRLAGVPRCYSMITGLGYTFGEVRGKWRLVNKVLRGLYRLGLRHNTAVFFQNPDDRDYFLASGLLRDRGKAVLINGSGVDIHHYADAPAVASPPSFLLVARLIEDKGVRLFAEAARALRGRHPGATFRVLGPIENHPAAIPEEDVRRWHDAGDIEYLGVAGDVRPALAGASVFVLPSYYREGTPRSILEALAMGRPVVTTDAPGCRETVVDGENGYLIPPRDARALEGAMERFILDPTTIPRMGRRSRAIAEEKYDVRKVNGVILDRMDLVATAP
jgi:glycosyltransferase involved in cell wall biosynthesis